MIITKVNRITMTILVIVGLFIGVEILDEETDNRRRAIIVTVTWQQHPKREGPGHIDVAGVIGKEKFVAQATNENPFVEAGHAERGEAVQIQAWAVDGPFVTLACAIEGATVVHPPLNWEGLRVMCSGSA